MKRDGYIKSKKEFLSNLSKKMACTYACKRFEDNPKFPKPIRQAGDIMSFVLPPHFTQPQEVNKDKISICQICSKVCRGNCGVCNRPACPSHREIQKITTCVNCLNI